MWFMALAFLSRIWRVVLPPLFRWLLWCFEFGVLHSSLQIFRVLTAIIQILTWTPYLSKLLAQFQTSMTKNSIVMLRVYPCRIVSVGAFVVVENGECSFFINGIAVWKMKRRHHFPLQFTHPSKEWCQTRAQMIPSLSRNEYISSVSMKFHKWRLRCHHRSGNLEWRLFLTCLLLD